MTICIGILASDGIVIAADAQESDTYFKRSVQKIMTWHTLAISDGPPRNPAALVIAGAGNGEFVDAFTGKLLQGIKPEMTITEFEEYAEKKLEGFYSTHVRPLLKVDQDSDFSVIVAAYFGFETRLYKSYRTSFRHVQGASTAVGFGQQYALRNLDEFPLVSDVRRTEIIAAAILSGTKDTIDGCGKYTDIVSIHRPTIVADEACGSRLVAPQDLWTRVPSRKIAQWEKSFSVVWGQRQRSLYYDLVEEELKRSESQTSEDQQ